MALPLAGRPVLHRVLDALASAVDGVVVVTGHEAARVRALVREWQTGRGAAAGFARTVHNPNYAEGMFSSVLAGAHAVPGRSFVFILPGDYPLLTTEVFLSLRAAALARAFARRHPGPDGPADVFIPRHNGRNGHPLLLAPVCFAMLRDRGASSGAGTLKEFLSEWHAAYIDAEDEGVLLDMDTPEEYARIEALLCAGGAGAVVSPSPDGAPACAPSEAKRVRGD